jgi:hypothetical protein
MSRYILLVVLVSSFAGAQQRGQGQPNLPPAKFESLQVMFLTAVAKNERTLLIFDVINASELPIGYNGSNPKDSQILPNQKALAPHLEVRVRDLKTGKSRDLNRQTLDHNVTHPAKAKGRFEVQLPPGNWDEFSVGIRWFEMRAAPARSGIAWSAPVRRKATIPGPSDSSQRPAASKVTDTEVLAIGGWSELKQRLRGRLVVLQRRRPNGKSREATVYLDLHHSAEAVGEPLHIRVDPKQRIELHGAVGKVVPGGISGSMSWRSERGVIAGAPTPILHR